MRIVVDGEVVEAIRREAEGGYPHEICGFLLGPSPEDGDPVRIDRIRPATNARAEARTRYAIDPDTYRTVEIETDRAGREILGFYHSHPDAPARPSAYDLEHAWPRVTYLIVTVEEGRAGAATAWRLAEDRSRFVPVDLEESDASL